MLTFNKKAIILSLILHFMLMAFIFGSLHIEPRKIEEKTSEIAISIVPPPKRVEIKKTINPPTKLPSVKPKPKIIRPAIKPKPEYLSAMQQLDKLSPNEIPIPFEHNEQAKKPLKNIKKAVKPQYTTEALALQYATLIGNCIKNKMQLIALGTTTNFNILVHFNLGRDKMLRGIPDIKIEGGDERQKNIAQNQTILALKACTPFDLPLDKYDIWKEVAMSFSPAQN